MTDQTPIAASSDLLETLRVTLENHPWAFAKTMPSVPHEYTLRRQWDTDLFTDVVKLIRRHGTPEKLWNFPVRRYLYIGAWRYWTMDKEAHITGVINRCDPTHPRYRGQFKKVIL